MLRTLQAWKVTVLEIIFHENVKFDLQENYSGNSSNLRSSCSKRGFKLESLKIEM
jgi:hypothetical protein